ncbi:transposase [Myxococcus xanthus]|uniref:Transposase n=1 Tax=Myxococcus xanthus TaxID=34 RepID=A0A7Y4MQ84_MYXXA|nr:transposase [Myxococcus xanthus]NOJ78162.1 transposase [Myxococcus xanthus]NOJ85161.1 transposase [Myxococcus xanthus]
MKEAWCLATSFDQAPAQEVMDAYGRRFTIEETFRDVKDVKFGMGLKQVR